MEQYVFVCIGTNKVISDSFGPRVGEKLKDSFKDISNIKVFGTMKEPIHFKNAKKILMQLENDERLKIDEYSKTILIDSAIDKDKKIGTTYVSHGGTEIGKAYGKSFYFPAYLSIKTVVSNKQKMLNINQVDLLAQNVANKIAKVIYEW